MSEPFKQIFEQVVSGAARQIIDAVNQMDSPSGRSDFPPPPETPAEMIRWRKKLTDLETSLTRFPHVIDALGDPASDAAIKNANHAVAPFRLPPWLEVLYRWHNGCNNRQVASLFELPFIPIEEAVRVYKSLNPLDYEFGFVRQFTFPFLGADSDWMLAVLDQTGSEPDDTLLYWHYHQGPAGWHESPGAWIDDLLRKLEEVDEDSFADGGQFNGYSGGGSVIHRTSPPREYGGVNASLWPRSYRERAGISNYLIDESQLPPVAERQLIAGQAISHVGPWEVYLGGIGNQVFKSGKTRLPAHLKLETTHYGSGAIRNQKSYTVDCLLPVGVLSDHTLWYGYDLDAVIWFRPGTLESDLPVIDKVRFPIKD